MSLSDLAAIGSFVSGIAVLISLIYVAIQIRQTERNQRTLLQQGTSLRNVEVLKGWLEPHTAEAFTKLVRGDTNFTSAEAFLALTQFRISMLNFQDMFMLDKLGLVDRVQLETQVRVTAQLLSEATMRAIWTFTQRTFASDFVEFINLQIKDVALIPPYDVASYLKAAIAEVKATAAN